MTISSMTGFARAEGHADGLGWVWELKSVNGKSLDLRFRLPPGFDALELPLRASLAQQLKRGAVTASLAVTRADAASRRPASIARRWPRCWRSRASSPPRSRPRRRGSTGSWRYQGRARERRGERGRSRARAPQGRAARRAGRRRSAGSRRCGSAKAGGSSRCSRQRLAEIAALVASAEGCRRDPARGAARAAQGAGRGAYRSRRPRCPRSASRRRRR